MSGKTFQGQDEDKEKDRKDGEASGCSGHDTVVVGEDGKFVKPCHKIPASCYVPCNEDSRGDGERVHESNLYRFVFPSLRILLTRSTHSV